MDPKTETLSSPTRSADQRSKSRVDELVQFLEELGIRSAFGIPGGPITELYYSLVNSKKIRTVLVQHENGGAFQALGRSMVSGGTELPVCFGTAGPGMTNLLTGVTAAHQENVPLFVITGNVATFLQGKGAVQDSSVRGFNAFRMFESVCAASISVTDSKQLLDAAQTLYELALKKRQPVHLNIPVDVAKSKALGFPKRFKAKTNDTPWDSNQTTAIEQFLKSDRPMIYAGNGIKLCDLEKRLLQVVHRFQIPCLSTSHGLGVLPESEPFYLGNYGLAAPDRAKNFMAQYDPTAILFLGTALGECATGAWTQELKQPELKIHVDHNPEVFNRFCQTTNIEQDLGQFLSQLLEQPNELRSAASVDLATKKISEFSNIDRDQSIPQELMDQKVHPAALIKLLDFYLPDDATVFSDIGNSMLWLFRYLRLRQNRKLFAPMGLGSMGSGIGSAIGAKTYYQSSPQDRPVACVTGDCALLMHGSELKTAQRENIPVKFFVLNDGGHGTVHHGHKMVGLPVDVRFEQRVDCKKFAESLGVEAHTIRSMKDLEQVSLGSLMDSDRPVLFDIEIDPEIAPPLNIRVKGRTGGVPGLVSPQKEKS